MKPVAEVAATLRIPSERTLDGFVGMDPGERADVEPRLPRRAVLHRERYYDSAAEEHIDDCDGSLAACNSRFGLAGDWTGRVLFRLKGPESMSGRHPLLDALKRLGPPSR